MADKMCENNQVTIMGEIVSDFSYSHEVYGEGFYMVEVSVHRLSSFVDYIPVMVSERLVNVQESAEENASILQDSSVHSTGMRSIKTVWCYRFLRGSLNWLSSLRKKMQPTRFFWMDLSVRNRYTEKHLWEGRSRIFWSQSTGHMANRTIFPASAGAEMQDLHPDSRSDHMCRSGEESRVASM